MGKLMRKIIKSDSVRNECGFLPKMATASKGSIGAWSASSFCKRVNFVENQVDTKGNSFLSPNEIDMLTLWMNIFYEAYEIIVWSFVA